jgi:diguanylate cyclase (GGDEF)-like protein
MLYIGSLAFLTLVSYFLAREVFFRAVLKRESQLSELSGQCESFSMQVEEVKAKNCALSDKVNETIELYNISKDISRDLDEGRVLKVFKERINSYIKISDCQFLYSDANLSCYAGYIKFPLVISNNVAGYFLVSGVPENDRAKLNIIAQEFLVSAKRALLYKRIQEIAITDGLTQAFSRRHFLERAKEELRRSRRFKYNFSFLMLDIDRFKAFNDNYGHLVGDAILRQVSATIKETIRQIDFIGRYGGEELSIVLPETEKEQAILAAQRIRSEIESRSINAYDEQVRVTASIGVATFPQDAVELPVIIEAADEALYQAKSMGRNMVCGYRRKEG